MGKWIHRLTEVDFQAKTAVCANCGPVAVKIKKRENGSLRPRCGVAWCQSQRDHARTPAGIVGAKRRRNRNRRGEHGLTYEEAWEYKNQTGCCEICGDTEKLAVDHSHVTGEVRGVLCLRCNVGLGQFRDNTAFLKLAITYLEARE